MEQFLRSQKQTIYSFLCEFLESKEKELKEVNGYGPDVIKRLVRFLKNGKMIRGGLIILTHEMYSGKYINDAIRTASALELFHSSFLIHDDIIDRDTLRRGEKTIGQQYKELGEQKKFSDSSHFGNSMAIGVGDIGFFLGYELLSSLECEPRIASKLLHVCSKELIKVGLGEMQDVHFGFQKESPSEDNILTMYRYKTARYTFSLPLMLGAILVDKTSDTLQNLDILGEYLGLIFQIKDDELGIYGTQDEIGKPVGSDIREGKKTLFLTQFYGKKVIHNVDAVRSFLETTGTRKRINELVQRYEKDVKNRIDTLDIAQEYKELFYSLLSYSIGRKK